MFSIKFNKIAILLNFSKFKMYTFSITRRSGLKSSLHGLNALGYTRVTMVETKSYDSLIWSKS